jgi:hypothetical protein
MLSTAIDALPGQNSKQKLQAVFAAAMPLMQGGLAVLGVRFGGLKPDQSHLLRPPTAQNTKPGPGPRQDSMDFVLGLLLVLLSPFLLPGY